MPIDILGAVPVVAVGVDDGNAFPSIMLPDPLHHHSLDIDIAEATIALYHLHRMVPWWTDEGEGMMHFLLHHQAGGLNGTSSRYPV